MTDDFAPLRRAGKAAIPQVFVARQPILDRARRVFAYELLFRASVVSEAAGDVTERASARVITDAVLAFGLDTLTQGRLAFINVTRRLLLEGLPAVLPPKGVVVELLEDIEADDEVLAACRDLRRAGYSLALDDFVLTDRNADLVPLADFIKVDFLATPTAEQRAYIAECRQRGSPALLAEKIETAEQFDVAVRDGFTYFQGFFFGRPITQGARDIPGDRIGHFRLLRALNDPELTVIQLENLIKHDAALCYRILRTVNSAGFAQRGAVESIRQALVLLGIDTVRHWASLWVLAGLSEGAHPELITMCTVRARCCELLAKHAAGEDASAEGFLFGLCSLLDVILDRPMDAVLEQLPLSATTKAALLGEDNASRRLLDCAIAYERGQWDRCLYLAGRAGLDPAGLPVAHQEALKWVRDFQRG